MMPVIQTNNLTYRYGDFTAVRDLNLDVQQGEIFGFLGPNGAGKTTTIRALMNFLFPTEGTATILGLNSRQDTMEIRRRVGYLPAELKMWENWHGTQYIKWLEKVHKKPLMQEARRLAESLDYDLDRSLQGLSTGMKRKMGLIASMVHQPELLIMDEPTNGLDPLMQQVYISLMREAQQKGCTIFISSHNLQEVETICDRVGIIRDGEMKAVETVEVLTHVAFRWLRLTFEQAVDKSKFESMTGVNDVIAENHTLRIQLGGTTDINVLLKQAVELGVSDLDMEHPTLEEIFLTYYGEYEEKKKKRG
jgi:ABC-2 type transport system ATP-binding protein